MLELSLFVVEYRESGCCENRPGAIAAVYQFLVALVAIVENGTAVLFGFVFLFFSFLFMILRPFVRCRTVCAGRG